MLVNSPSLSVIKPSIFQIANILTLHDYPLNESIIIHVPSYTNLHITY